MPKLILMQGLPGSGKSTKSREIYVSGKNVRLNRDLLREMLHFKEWSERKEKRIKQAELNLAELFLKQGLDVIVDDCNLAPKTIRMWEVFAEVKNVEIEWIKLNTSLELCIARDNQRERTVGEKAIREMAKLLED
jgi:predicted kinase